MSPFWSTNSGRSGLDHHLLQAVAESTLLLGNGCLCCAVRGDLQQALRNLLSQRTRGEVPHFRRVVIETSGLADPSPIAYTLLSEQVLRHHFRLSGIITTVDAVNGALQLGEFTEAVKQVSMADRLVVTKTDLSDEGSFAALRARLRALNVSAQIVESAEIRGDIHQVLTDDIYDSAGKFREARHWIAEEVDAGVADHTAGVSSFVVVFDRPLDWTAFGVWASMLLHRYGADVLRTQGSAQCSRGADAGADQRRPAHRSPAKPSRTVARLRPALAVDLHRPGAAARAHRAFACRV